tara:strand:- start:585 stop:899 length:315 start_codon:yes stop_codon:yes gene_type:complete
MSTSKPKAVRVYLQNTESAGYFYSNIVSNVVSILGMKARYQQGSNSAGEKKHFWFINEDDVNAEKLPQKAWGIINGDVVTDEQYATLSAPSAHVDETQSESAGF